MRLNNDMARDDRVIFFCILTYISFICYKFNRKTETETIKTKEEDDKGRDFCIDLGKS